MADHVRHDDGGLWQLLDLLVEATTPGLLHRILRGVLGAIGADEVSLYAGTSPPVLIAAHGDRVFAGQTGLVDPRLARACDDGVVVALDHAATGQRWQVEPGTAIHHGLWVPAPADARTPAVLRALRVRPEPFAPRTAPLLGLVVKRLSIGLWRLHREQIAQSRDAERAQLFLVSATVAQDLDFTAVAQRVVEGVTAVTDFAYATVEVVRDATVRRAAAVGDDLAAGIASPLALWRTALTDDRGVGELTYRVELHRSLPARGGAHRAGSAAGLVTQLRNRDGQVAGFLTLSGSRTGAEPTVAVIQTIELFARQAQIALVNAALYVDAKRQRDIARTLMRVISAVSGSLETSQILDTCCDAAETHSVGERASIFLLDEHGTVHHATDGRRSGPGPRPVWTPRPLEDCAILAEAVRAPEPLIIDDVSESVRYAASPVARMLGLRSAAVHPLRAGGSTLGLLVVDSHSGPVRFDAQETALLAQIAAQAAVALRQAVLHEQTREQADRNAQLLELTTAMTTTLEFEAIFRRIVDAVTARLDTHAVSVLRVGDGWVDVLGSTSSGTVRCPRPPLRLVIDEHLADALALVWRDGTLRMDDVRACPALSSIARPDSRGVVLAAPTERGDTNVLLTVSSTQTDAFTQADERFLADLVQVIRLAVRNADLFDEVADSARRDPLTGLLNRRVFWTSLQERLTRAGGWGASTVALAVIDADDFKRVNDRFGHAVGDAALQHIADRLTGSVRRSDQVFRIGGEEFTVVMPDATARDADRVMQRALRSVRDGHGDLPELSVSVGVAVAPYDGSTADALFGEADRALLDAKRSGKDRVRLRRAVA